MSRQRSTAVVAGPPVPTPAAPIPAAPIPAVPTLALTPGLHLRRAVDIALLDLKQASQAERSEVLGAMRKVNDNLHGALAHTAAIGETCMIAAAVQAVHAAEDHLAAAELSQATVALTTARERLTPPSAKREQS